MTRQRSRSQLDSMNEINITPMMDLVFLLLIVFIISTPLLENSIDVSPPEANAGEIEDENMKEIIFKKDGTIVYNKQPYSLKDFEEKLQEIYKENPKYNMALKADGALEYKEVIEVLEKISKVGFKNVNLITIKR